MNTTTPLTTHLDNFSIEQVKLLQAALGVYLAYREELQVRAGRLAKLAEERAGIIAEMDCLQNSLPPAVLNGQHK
jgi:hypothetical protein